jgi:hypothetical protein
MKKIIYILVFVLLINFVVADKVYLFNFNYDNGKITLLNQIIKEGYYPDRKIPVENSYSCELNDKEEKKLYSLDFDIPNKITTDAIVDLEIEGNTIVLEEVNFSFALPYYEIASNLICYNERNYEILNEKLVHESLSQKKSNKLIYGYIIIVFIGFLFVVIKSRKKQEKLL